MVAANVFVRAPDSASPYFLSRGAALRSYFLRQAITRYAVDPDAVVDITVPDVTAKALEVTLDSAERRFKADEDVIALTARAKVDAADRATVDELDGEALATVVGAAHQLGVQPLLGLASAKLAERMSSGEAAWWTDDLLSPARDLSDADTKAAGREYIFTAPAAPAAADVPRLAAATEQSDDLLRTRAAAAAAAEAAAAGNGSSGHHHTLSIPLSAAAPEAAATAECKLLRWLGSESALASCLARLDGPSLARLKALGSVWRERARAALSSTTWREWQRSASRHLAVRVELCAGAVVHVVLPLARVLGPVFPHLDAVPVRVALHQLAVVVGAARRRKGVLALTMVLVALPLALVGVAVDVDHLAVPIHSPALELALVHVAVCEC